MHRSPYANRDIAPLTILGNLRQRLGRSFSCDGITPHKMEGVRLDEKRHNSYTVLPISSTLRMFALIVSAHPYCAGKFTDHVMHESTR